MPFPGYKDTLSTYIGAVKDVTLTVETAPKSITVSASINGRDSLAVSFATNTVKWHEPIYSASYIFTTLESNLIKIYTLLDYISGKVQRWQAENKTIDQIEALLVSIYDLKKEAKK